MHDIMKYGMIRAMQRYGGGFVQALSECFVKADSSNFDKLCKAFPEYVEQYLDLAGRDAAQQAVADRPAPLFDDNQKSGNAGG